VASGGMYAQRISVSDLQSAHGTYDGAKAYARTKRGQVILTELWAGALAPCGVVVHSMHPGWADTPGVSTSLPRFYSGTIERHAQPIGSPELVKPPRSARPCGPSSAATADGQVLSSRSQTIVKRSSHEARWSAVATPPRGHCRARGYGPTGCDSSWPWIRSPRDQHQALPREWTRARDAPHAA
jgi:NAD(P)-dependent dehydrogenase (short-subunit alcohol dehydrogenase family)